MVFVFFSSKLFHIFLVREFKSDYTICALFALLKVLRLRIMPNTDYIWWIIFSMAIISNLFWYNLIHFCDITIIHFWDINSVTLEHQWFTFGIYRALFRSYDANTKSNRLHVHSLDTESTNIRHIHFALKFVIFIHFEKYRFKVARSFYQKCRVFGFFILFKKMNQIGSKNIRGHGPFKLKMLLLYRYVKGTMFQWNDTENRGVDIF